MNLTTLTSSKNQLTVVQGKGIGRSTKITMPICGLRHLYPVRLTILTVKADAEGKTKKGRVETRGKLCLSAAQQAILLDIKQCL